VDLPSTQVYAVWFDDATKRAAFRTVNNLRQAGLRAEMATGQGKRSFKSQMRAADKSPARYTLIFGDRELAEGRVEVKDMLKGEQVSVPLKELGEWLDHRLTT
jgi:histidyl-tRNA synthetase